ncbi:C protein [Henipavirus nipahense]|uniref:C protein n=1 Tax=Nipah virus TaxID=3052225 RepID=Q4VCP8_NIPAV|nr:C protein [Henipavirus nipahense]AEZ01378.1 C protein [Henipavirus nipahense]AEZ01386.1 C protein [Henipavirus nipahense]AEZ01400.1 C protein [Henipavirus nipahense]QHR79007.1 C protein [Henipavirus nipahense]
MMASILLTLFRRTKKKYRRHTDDQAFNNPASKTEQKHGRIFCSAPVENLNKLRGECLRMMEVLKEEAWRIYPVLLPQMELLEKECRTPVTGQKVQMTYNWTQWLQTLYTMIMEENVPDMDLLQALREGGVITHQEQTMGMYVLYLMQRCCPMLPKLQFLKKIGKLI